MIGPEVFFLCVILAAFFSVAAVLSAIACCENGRQFQSLSPIPMVVGGYLLAAGLRRLAVS
jgi:hypothetical protein